MTTTKRSWGEWLWGILLWSAHAGVFLSMRHADPWGGFDVG